MGDASADFRKELLKIMPGYKWTVHKSDTTSVLCATGVQTAGFNRLSTLSVSRVERGIGPWYEVKSAGFGRRSPWLGKNADTTLARALRGLQNHYDSMASTYRRGAASLQTGRQKESA